MPLYEYLCHKCGKKFDALQKFSDQPLTVAADCGHGGDCELERLVSPPAFHFKGTGWYVTDYAKSNGVSAPAADGSKNNASSSEAKSESKSESKSGETKTESAPKPAATTTPSSSDK